MEFNTGLPFGLADSDFAGVTPDRYLGVLLARVKEIAPDVDPGTVENMVIQYYLQTRAQHRYRLQRYDGRMVIYEPAVPQNGLLYAQFKPYVKDLRVVSLRVGKQPERTRRVSEVFSEFIRPHYLSMRDDEFVRQLARELEPLLA